MSGTINFGGIDALISTAAAQQEALVQDNHAHEMAIVKNNEQLVILQAKIGAYHDVMNMQLHESASVSTAPAQLFNMQPTVPKVKDKRRIYANRRMRLGAKKRVVYKLIMMGKNTFDDINEVIGRSSLDIDHRYVREVLRSGKEDGDFEYCEDGSVVLTPEGRGIIEKAPKPMDWLAYELPIRAALAPDDDRDYN